MSRQEVEEISCLVGVEDNSVIKQYETEFAKVMGEDGYCTSFAAGRMAFYAFLKSVGVGEGDEVILTGFTCSVMSNAVLRVGAVPIYADIMPCNYGTDPGSVASKIGPKTKVIVAQHSFGIPCKIEEISKIAKENNIFLVEDCAIALGSAVNGKIVGTFGDASIFSTDHSKPLNTIIGGMLYTRSKDIFSKIKLLRDESPSLDIKRQAGIFEQFLLERIYQNPEKYALSKLLGFKSNMIKKLGFFGGLDPFLTADYTSNTEHKSYPYPAKLPPFLAQIGIFELRRWSNEKNKRKQLLSDMLNLAKLHGVDGSLPIAYFDDKLEIIPLRFAFNNFCTSDAKKYLSTKIDMDWFWFKTPIVCADDLESLCYADGNCSISEELNEEIINIPMVHDDKYSKEILKIFENFLILRTTA